MPRKMSPLRLEEDITPPTLESPEAWALPDSLPEESEHNRFVAAWGPSAPSEAARGS